MVMAALSMLFTQCKKTESASPLAPAGDGQVSITLDVDGGNSKADVNTLSGVVTFKSGDVIYVASNGAYVGYLTYSDGTSRFEGTLTNPTEGQPLYFYFLGNKGPATANLTTSTTELTADISDQSDGLPVISGAASDRNYTSDVTGYSARLLNNCALVKFDVQNYDGNDPVSITGTDGYHMKNKVRVNLGSNSFSYGETNNGKITLNHKSGSEYWAILLPQDKVPGGAASSSDGWRGAFSDMPEIECNAFLTNAIKVNQVDGKITNFSINEDYETSNDLNFDFTIEPNDGCVINGVTLCLSLSDDSPDIDHNDLIIEYSGLSYETGSFSISKNDLIYNPPFYESGNPIYIRLCAIIQDSDGFCGEPVCVYSDVKEISFEFGDE